MADPISYVPHVRLCKRNGNLVVCVASYVASGEKITYSSGTDSIIEMFKIGTDSSDSEHWAHAESTGRPMPEKPVDVIVIVEKGTNLYRSVTSSDRAEPCD